MWNSAPDRPTCIPRKIRDHHKTVIKNFTSFFSKVCFVTCRRSLLFKLFSCRLVATLGTDVFLILKLSVSFWFWSSQSALLSHPLQNLKNFFQLKIWFHCVWNMQKHFKDRTPVYEHIYWFWSHTFHRLSIQSNHFFKLKLSTFEFQTMFFM